MGDPVLLKGCGLTVASCSPKMSLQSLLKQLLDFGDPYTELLVVPFPDWIKKVKIDASLSCWPIFTWAESMTEFPVFNTRPLFNDQPLVLSALDFPGGAAACDRLRMGMQKDALHAMLQF